MVIRLAFAAQACGIDADRPGEFHGARVERPAIGRDEPGGADDLALAERRKDDRGLPGGDDLEGHPAVADQEELVRGVAFAKQILPGIEAMVARAARHERAVLRREAGKERMLAQGYAQDPPCVSSLGRIAASP